MFCRNHRQRRGLLRKKYPMYPIFIHQMPNPLMTKMKMHLMQKWRVSWPYWGHTSKTNSISFVVSRRLLLLPRAAACRRYFSWVNSPRTPSWSHIILWSGGQLIGSRLGVDRLRRPCLGDREPDPQTDAYGATQWKWSRARALLWKGTTSSAEGWSWGEMVLCWSSNIGVAIQSYPTSNHSVDWTSTRVNIAMTHYVDTLRWTFWRWDIELGQWALGH